MTDRPTQLSRWQSELWNLMSEIQIADGEVESDLGAMVRFAWMEARRKLHEAEQPGAVA